MFTVVCAECNGPLDMEYGSDVPAPRSGTQFLRNPHRTVTLGEGNTPLVQFPRAAELIGVRRLYGKLEFMNPTGSFKDRGSTVMVSAASEMGVTELVEDSSGNAGASVAAYASAAGIKAHVFVPANAPESKLKQIGIYGAEVHCVQGSREDVAKAAAQFSFEHGLVYASHALCPFFIEGTKMFAHEIKQQCEDGLPDHIVIPTGNGSLVIGVFKGLRELYDMGLIEKFPKIHAVQAKAISPVVAEFNGTKWSSCSTASTNAGGIAVANPPRLRQMVATLRATGGTAISVDEVDILRWHNLLPEMEGVFAEQTSSSAFAGIENLVNTSVIRLEESVLTPVTGSGLKDLS